MNPSAAGQFIHGPGTPVFPRHNQLGQRQKPWPSIGKNLLVFGRRGGCEDTLLTPLEEDFEASDAMATPGAKARAQQRREGERK